MATACRMTPPPPGPPISCSCWSARSATSRTSAKASRRRFSPPACTVDRLLKTETSDRLAAAAARVAALLTDFQLRKIAAERTAREQAARAAREAADALATSAQADPALREQALALDQAAQQAEIAATSGVAALARTRGETGAVANLKEEWTYEVVDFALVPRAWLMVDDRKVRAAIRGAEGLRGIPGLHIHPELVRRCAEAARVSARASFRPPPAGAKTRAP